MVKENIDDLNMELDIAVHDGDIPKVEQISQKIATLLKLPIKKRTSPKTLPSLKS